MFLFRVSRDPGDVGHDELAGLVVIAEGPQEAVTIARGEARDEGPDAWCNASLVMLAPVSEATLAFLDDNKIVLRSFRAG